MRYILTAILLALGLAAAAGAVNYLADPLWCFDRGRALGLRHDWMNERQQKTDRVAYGDFDYQGLLLGSSRATFIDQNAFSPMSIFNYSVSAMIPEEYARFAAFARQKNRRPFEVIYLGLDFSGALVAPVNPLKPDFRCFENVADPFYRYKTLFSADTLLYSFRSARNTLMPSAFDSYDSGNVKRMAARSQIEIHKAVDDDTKAYSAIYCRNGYKEDYRETLKTLVRDNPGTRFVAFTTPVSMSNFSIIQGCHRMDNYRRWLKDAADVFGGFHHFMYPNSVTRDPSNFYDSHHFTERVGSMIAARITGDNKTDVPPDFGVYLTTEAAGGFEVKR
jgi:hypothetical protein